MKKNFKKFLIEVFYSILYTNKIRNGLKKEQNFALVIYFLDEFVRLVK